MHALRHILCRSRTRVPPIWTGRFAISTTRNWTCWGTRWPQSPAGGAVRKARRLNGERAGGDRAGVSALLMRAGRSTASAAGGLDGRNRCRGRINTVLIETGAIAPDGHRWTRRAPRGVT